MRHLVIIGAGGFGREMYAAALGAVGYGTDFDVRGFLDARADALAGFTGYPPVVGTPEDYAVREDDVFVTALGSVAARRRCAELVARRGGRFVPVVHRTAFVGPNVRVGEGAFIAQNAVLTADISVGRHACVFQNTTVGHDSVIGDYAHVYSQCAVGGGVRIGEGALVYPGSSVVPRRRIGDGAVVGVGSVVILNVPAGTTVFGNPAMPRREA